MGAIKSVVERRQTPEGRALTASLPPELQAFCDPAKVQVTPVEALEPRDGDGDGVGARL